MPGRRPTRSRPPPTRAQFRACAERYAAKPPVPCDRDAEFAATLARPGGTMALAVQAAVLDYLARRPTGEAPPAQARDAESTALVDAVQASVNALRATVGRQDEAAVREAIGKIRSPCSRLFVKFV